MSLVVSLMGRARSRGGFWGRVWFCVSMFFVGVGGRVVVAVIIVVGGGVGFPPGFAVGGGGSG